MLISLPDFLPVEGINQLQSTDLQVLIVLVEEELVLPTGGGNLGVMNNVAVRPALTEGPVATENLMLGDNREMSQGVSRRSYVNISTG